ncbi:heterokaryon incompatibility protein-domain-containing protein [Plectosphaerella plurivora]|uniref:Heterokaryon incompatibility protein-domain-containing protein n=1 Tax=Plectosphaerella plurivora TaxID=936078 RepID=A0A9P9A849_9PEZI|nr:heterokaryon incompatibility protein-domain-containing protein [Plectosphaerella plurivora]
MDPKRPQTVYQHPPLHGVTPARLLSLHCDTTTNTIHGRLISFDLDARSTPAFSTLSYEWGSPTYTNTITLDGHPFPILDNLYPILVLLCNASEHKWLWIDSICIDQQDLQERASQVQLMQRIFAQSEKTIAWLGESSPEIDEGIDFLYTLAKSHSKIMNFSTVNDTREVPVDLRLPEKWRALGKFLDINWWRRMWTLQEFVIAEDPILCCGTKQVEMFTLEAGLSAIWFCEPDSSLMRPGLWALTWSRERLRQWHHDSGYTDHMGLIALLAYTSSSEVTNPRDRIYGLLGLVNQEDREMVGRPDYLASVEDVYNRLAKSFIETHSSLDIICFAQTFHRPASLTTSVGTTPDILPSWVPDWRVHAEPYVTPFMVSQTSNRSIGNFRPIACDGFEDEPRDENYCADGISDPKVIIDLDTGRLICRGYLVGQIDGIGTTLKSADHLTVDQDALPITQSSSIYNIPLQPPPPAPSPSKSKALLSTIVRCLTLDREDRYLTFEAPYEIFTTQFLNLLTFAEIENPEILPARCRSALSWYNFNKHLFLRGRTLEQLCHDCMGPEPLDDEALCACCVEENAG